MLESARSSRLRATALGVLLSMATGAACNVTGARVHNLGELHTDDGYHKHTAALLSGWEWLVRAGFAGMIADREVSLGDMQPEKVDDPNETCLHNLVELGLHTGEGGYERSVRIAVYARLVVNCPWKLSRERCTILLGREGRALDMQSHPTPPLRGAAVEVEPLTGALGELLAAARPTLEHRKQEPDPLALQASCEKLRAFQYDLAGAQRALAMVALIARSAPAKDADFDCVRELTLVLQRTTVDRALRAALVDARPFERSGSDPGWDSPRVRAAAVEAWLVAVGPLALVDFLGRIDPRENVDVLLAVLRGVARFGFPPTLGDATPEEYAAWKERSLEILVSIAMDHPEGRVRTAAMYALERVSGAELVSLREEDWYDWYIARVKALAAERAVATEALREAANP